MAAWWKQPKLYQLILRELNDNEKCKRMWSDTTDHGLYSALPKCTSFLLHHASMCYVLLTMVQFSHLEYVGVKGFALKLVLHPCNAKDGFDLDWRHLGLNPCSAAPSHQPVVNFTLEGCREDKMWHFTMHFFDWRNVGTESCRRCGLIVELLFYLKSSEGTVVAFWMGDGGRAEQGNSLVKKQKTKTELLCFQKKFNQKIVWMFF